MKITKNKDNVIFSNKDGEYHFSVKEYEKLGAEEAIRIACVEIRKKNRLDNYGKKEIDFKSARDLGFCEYGIKDWCSKTKIDVNKTYTIKNLKDKLTLEAFLEYPSECRKLFGNNVLDIFGGVETVLEDNENINLLDYIFNNNYLSDENMRLLACQFAEDCLHIFEKEYPDDDRPRKAIEATRKYALDPTHGNKQAAYSANSAAYSAAYSAYSANSAAYSAAYSAYSAAYSAARSAANSARSAAYSANSARSAQSNLILTVILSEGESIK